MTAPFVTLAQVKGPLRIDDDAADDQLDLMIAAATDRILHYLNGVSPMQPETEDDGTPVLDDDGLPVYTDQVRPMVKSATLTLIGYMYRYPTGDEKKAYDPDVLPAPVTALLGPLRRKVLV